MYGQEKGQNGKRGLVVGGARMRGDDEVTGEVRSYGGRKCESSS